jgi:hypothetical protein
MMRLWCRQHDVPIGFFAERPLAEVRLRREWTRVAPHIWLAKASSNVLALARHAAAILRAEPFPLRGLRRVAQRGWVEPAESVRYVLRFDVDLERKHSLLAAYGSQLAGLREYASFTAEYLYLIGRRALAAFPWGAPWRS